MIHVDRESIPKPEFWDSDEFQDFLKEWCRFHGEKGGSRGTQKRMPFASELDHFKRLALLPLLKAFHYKCAYTEEQIDEKSAVVVFHRPESDATDLDGNPSPPHYWWALCDWSNWLPASREVQIAKSTSFPVAGERTEPPASGEVPSNEWLDEHRDDGLLLDPTRDFPCWHLEFLDDGTVRPRRHSGKGREPLGDGTTRGELTIEILGLNLSDMASRRRAAIGDSIFLPYSRFQS